MTGEELREGRKRRGWTQSDLARRLGLSQGYVCLLERGQRPVPPVMAQKVVRLLDVPATALPLRSPSAPLAEDGATTALATLTPTHQGSFADAAAMRTQAVLAKSATGAPNASRAATVGALLDALPRPPKPPEGGRWRRT